jgi:hypothetical protein
VSRVGNRLFNGDVRARDQPCQRQEPRSTDLASRLNIFRRPLAIPNARMRLPDASDGVTLPPVMLGPARFRAPAGCMGCRC